MKHPFLPLAAALILGGAGCVVRLWERRSAYDAASGLTELSSPAVWLLLILTAAAVVMALVCSRSMARRPFPGGYDQAFYAPNSIYPTLLILSAVAMLLSAGLAGLDYRNDLMLYALGYLQTSPSALKIVLAVLAVVSALCLFPIAKNGYRALGKGKQFAPLLAPAFFACIWLVVSYLEEAANPDMMSFVFGRMAAICAALALYYVSSFSFEKAKPGRTVFFSMLALFFSLISLGDSGALFLKVISGSAVLLLSAQLGALCWNNSGEHVPHSDPSEVTTDEP